MPEGRNESTGLLFLTLALATFALAAETAQERGKRVIDEALEAVGGKAYLAMEDRVESGRAYSFFRQELQGLDIATIYSRYVTPVPGKPSVRERQIFGKDASGGVLFNQDGAWEITFRGARLMEPKRIENWRDGTLRNVFYILRQRLKEPGIDFYSRGSDLYENLPVEIVDITDAAGLTVTVYFSRSTKLPVRQVLKRRNPEYKISTRKRPSSPSTATWAAASSGRSAFDGSATARSFTRFTPRACRSTRIFWTICSRFPRSLKSCRRLSRIGRTRFRTASRSATFGGRHR